MGFRTYSDVIGGTLEIEIGTFKIEYQKQFVTLRAVGPLTVNRVQYRGFVSLALDEGKWRRESVRVDRMDNSRELGQLDAAFIRLEKILPQAWTSYLVQHPELVAEAERRFLNNEIYDREGRRVSLWNKIQTMRDEISKLDDEIESLKTKERPVPVRVPVVMTLPFESPQPG